MLRPADPDRPPAQPVECREVAERMDAYIDSDISAEAAAAMTQHLERCPSCREEHRLATRVQADLGSLGELDAPARALAAIRQAVADEPMPFERPRARAGSWRPWLAAAAVLLVAALSYLWLPRPVVPGPDAAPDIQAEVVMPSEEELEEARAQARLALSIVATVSRRTGEGLTRDVVGRQLVRPALRSLERMYAPIDSLIRPGSDQPAETAGT